MIRTMLTDAQWARMEPHCLGRPGDPGRTGSDARQFVEAVLWIARTGAPWRDLPPAFGAWNTFSSGSATGWSATSSGACSRRFATIPTWSSR